MRLPTLLLTVLTLTPFAASVTHPNQVAYNLTFWGKKKCNLPLKGSWIFRRKDEDKCTAPIEPPPSQVDGRSLSEHSVDSGEIKRAIEAGTLQPVHLEKRYSHLAAGGHRLQKRARKCVKLHGAKSFSVVPEKGDETRGGEKNMYTVYIIGYKSGDCSGDAAKSYSADGKGCAEFGAGPEPNIQLKSAEIFISVCGNPFG